jgi:hypothetical protein
VELTSQNRVCVWNQVAAGSPAKRWNIAQHVFPARIRHGDPLRHKMYVQQLFGGKRLTPTAQHLFGRTNSTNAIWQAHDITAFISATMRYRFVAFGHRSYSLSARPRRFIDLGCIVRHQRGQRRLRRAIGSKSSWDYFFI